MKKKYKILIIVMLVIVAACAAWFGFIAPKTESENVADMEETEKVQPVGPQFNTDSAYAYVKKQCDFGPRDMNSTGHEQCKDWIIGKFKQFGCKVTTQQAQLTGYDGTRLNSTNIIASINPKATTRILICAHWDSRPWADNDPDSANWHKPILAANDAASGVAVMLELARVINNAKKTGKNVLPANLGVDFVCFDAEDWGTPQWASQQDDGDNWALGAQYFASNLPKGYEARYGILLDMVGGQGAQFYREQMSVQYAGAIVKGMARRKASRLWQLLPQQRRRGRNRRPYTREPEGQHTYHRHYTLLSRLCPKQLRTHMAYAQRRYGPHRPQHAEGRWANHGTGYLHRIGQITCTVGHFTSKEYKVIQIKKLRTDNCCT